jgi:hypothetical protein
VLAEAEGLPSPLEQRDGGSGDGESDDQPPPPCRVSVPLLDCPDPSLDLDLPGSCARVVGLDFHFFDDSTGEFRDKWNSFEDPTLDRLPAAVKIDLLLADATGNVNAFSTIADIPLALGQPTPNPLGQDAPDPNNPDPNDPNAGLTDPTPGHGGRQ